MTTPDGAGRPAPRRRRRRTTVLALSVSALAVVWVSSHSSLETVVVQAPAAAPTPEQAPVERAIEAPASRSQAARAAAKAVGSTSVVPVASTGGLGGIPSVALSAYQRAESVINAADPACRVSWQLLAAIGSVESDHGRHDGAVLDDDGRARPAVLGPVLDGGQGTALIRDTDAGQYDGDEKHDRAVGPMQFIPSTWAVVGVDADDDGRRDPQDIDDAALAAAVYLCSGPDDLSTDAGQRAALKRYNNSGAYVAAVLSRTANYLDSAALDVLAGGGGGATTLSAGLSTGSLGMAPLAAARALQGGLGVAEAANPFFSEIAESVDDAGSEPGRPTTVAARLRGGPDRPGDGGATPTAGDGTAGDGAAGDGTATGAAGTPSEPGQPSGPARPGPASGGSTPAPSETPTAPAVPPVPSSEEVAADIFCTDLVADLDVTDAAEATEEYDACLAEQLPSDDDPADTPDLTGLLVREDQG